jgi:hypothetical protein
MNQNNNNDEGYWLTDILDNCPDQLIRKTCYQDFSGFPVWDYLKDKSYDNEKCMLQK